MTSYVKIVELKDCKKMCFCSVADLNHAQLQTDLISDCLFEEIILSFTTLKCSYKCQNFEYFL